MARSVTKAFSWLDVLFDPCHPLEEGQGVYFCLRPKHGSGAGQGQSSTRVGCQECSVIPYFGPETIIEIQDWILYTMYHPLHLP